jgi:hypothetical protein
MRSSWIAIMRAFNTLGDIAGLAYAWQGASRVREFLAYHDSVYRSADDNAAKYARENPA